MKYCKFLVLLLWAISLFPEFTKADSAIPVRDYPLLGAQVFIEPGQTEQETEQWFKALHDNGMTICRIRMFESYMRKADGWDFSLFDRAFRLAEKYDIKVVGTFFPLTDKTDIGGWKFPKDQSQLDSFAEYIEQMTTHFKQFKSLYAWVLINEPGGGLKDTEFSRAMRVEWNKQHPQPEYLENGYPVLVDLQNERFKNYMTTWMLNWIASEVRKYDKDIHLHVNNHAIFSNLCEYNFPEWRQFLNSLGGSAHASWHFTLFPRREYSLAMSADCELLLSGAGNLPWFMTEVQGGNNTYSGNHAMCPTKEEITQWLWVVMGTESKGGIFWSLNPRASGIESGEWALLDFQHQPTDRVTAVAEVSRCLNQHKSIFANARKMNPGISIVYIRESLWTEGIVTQDTPASKDGRIRCMTNMLGYFKALSESGITPDLKAFEEYDFSRSDYTGQTIILAHQIAVPLQYVAILQDFVKKGGKLIVDGLTGFYDGDVHNRMLTGFPLRELFGGCISEFKQIDAPYLYRLKGYEVPLPGYAWTGFIRPDKGAEILCGEEGQLPLATRFRYGKGDVVWIPGLLGSAAWENDGTALAGWIRQECNTARLPFAFNSYHKDMLMKVMEAKEGFITVIVNKSGTLQTVGLQANLPKSSPVVWFADKGGAIDGALVTIHPEETVVLYWKK